MPVERVLALGFLILVALCAVALAADGYVRVTTAQLEACGRNPALVFCAEWVAPR